MKTVYRYSVNDPSGINKIQLPMDAKVVSAGVAFNPETGVEEISIWADVDTENPMKERTIIVAGTGAALDEMTYYQSRFIATVQKSNRFAFHVFEVEE